MTRFSLKSWALLASLSLVATLVGCGTGDETVAPSDTTTATPDAGFGADPAPVPDEPIAEEPTPGEPSVEVTTDETTTTIEEPAPAELPVPEITPPAEAPDATPSAEAPDTAPAEAPDATPPAEEPAAEPPAQ